MATDRRKPWELFSTKNMIVNYRRLSACLEKTSNHKVRLSYHPGLIFDSIYMSKMVRRGLPVTSIDLPDVVSFMDQRIINELSKKQPFRFLIGRMIDHIGWRLINWPSRKWRQNNLVWLIKNLPAGLTVKISSGSLESIKFDFPGKEKIRVAVELDAFAHESMNDYLTDIFRFIVKNGLDRQKVGLSIDPAHIYQGFIMNKWSEPIGFIEETIERGWKIFCLDINPIEILIENEIIYENSRKTEEEVEKIVKTHAGFEKNRVNYTEIIKMIGSRQINTKDLEICLEMHPLEAEKIREKDILPSQLDKIILVLNR